MARVWRPTEDEALGRCKDLTAAQIKENLAARAADGTELIKTAEAEKVLAESEEANGEKSRKSSKRELLRHGV